MRRYSIVYEVLYGSQYVVTFNINKDGSKSFKSIMVPERYTGISSVKDSKYNLCDIDKLTVEYASINDFIRTQKVYSPLHSSFVFYKHGGYMKTMNLVFNSKYIKELLDSGKVVDDEVTDKNRITYISDRFCNDKGFLKRFINGNYSCPREFTTAVEHVAYSKNEFVHDNCYETMQEFDLSKKELESHLKKYHIYREALRCLEDYENSKKQEVTNISVSEKKKDNESPKIKRKVNIENQILFNGFDDED